MQKFPDRIGKYRVERLLGRGGMGQVYLAVDPDIGRQVAIKQITLGSDPQARERFIHEAQTMGRLNHPNIATLLEFSADQDEPFLVLELLSGVDLSDWMDGPHTLAEQLAVMHGIACALEAAHRAGVLHRDLKPENVRVLEDGRAKLLDFGIARTEGGGLTSSGFFVGTPEYVAPEVIAGEKHSQSSDIYSLGLLYYVLLIGENPLRAETLQATVARVVQRVPPTLSTRLDGVPEALETMITACLSKDPRGRPASVSLIATLLARLLAQTNPDLTLNKRTPTPTVTLTPLVSNERDQTRANSLPNTQSEPTRASPLTPQSSRLPWLFLGLVTLVALSALTWYRWDGGASQALVLSEPASGDSQAESKPVDAFTSQEDKAEPPSAAVTATGDTTNPEPNGVSAADVEPAASKTGNAPAQPEFTAPRSATDVAQAESKPPPIADKLEPRHRSDAAPGSPRAVQAEAPTTRTPVATAQPPLPTSSETRRTIVNPPAVPNPDVQAELASERPPTAQAKAVEPVRVDALQPTLAELEITRYSPLAVPAGRSTAFVVEGAALNQVTAVEVKLGRRVDDRFRVNKLRYEGGRLLFTVFVARGVPLGSYALELSGETIKARSLMLEVSL